MSRDSLSVAPYPGLRPFEVEESDIFFGREKQTDEILNRLQRVRFLAIVGPSGCGKSSLIRAGLISDLETGFMVDAGSKWRIAWLRPGDRPIRRLAESVMKSGLLRPEDSDRADTPLFLEAALRRGPLGLAEVIEESGLTPGTNVLVVVDQFEELFRFRAQGDPDEADAFVALLLATARQTALPIYVIIAMRSDFLGDCSLFHDLPEAINDSSYLIPRLTREQCSIAITGPARVFRGEVESSLVNRLLNDFGPDPDRLPLLQHALMRMWECHVKTGGTTDLPAPLTVGDYESVGGLASSLSNHADETLNELTAGQQRIAKCVFQRLTERGVGKRDTRAPARLSEIASVVGVDPHDADLHVVLNSFRQNDRSFITPRHGDLQEDTLIDIGHESLIRQWKQLARWVDEEAESALIYARLRDTAQLWEADMAGLWRDPDLGRAMQWRDRMKPTEAWAARYGRPGDFARAMKFLDASEASEKARQAEAESARRRSLRTARRLGVFYAAVAFLAVGSLAYYLMFSREYSSYYNDVVKINGAPSGIGQLTRKQVHRRSSSIKIVRKGIWGRVLRMVAVNSEEQPTPRHSVGAYLDDESETLANTPVRWEYDSDENGQVLQESAYNVRGERVWVFMYSPLSGPPERRTRTGYFADANGLPTPGRKRSKTSVVIEYAPDGHEVAIRYRSRLGKPVAAQDSAFGLRRRFDDRGRIIEWISLGPDDQSMNDEDGNAIMKFVLDDLGNPIDRISVDAANRRTIVSDGWSREHTSYDANGNAVATAYFDENDRPTWHKDGYHRVSYTYDERGNVSTASYWNVDGKPTLEAQGCHEYRYTNDTRGNRVRSVCIGENDKHRPDVNGVTIATFKYDERDNEIEMAFWDKSNRRTENNAGYSVVRYAYDDHDNQIGWSYFGVNGQPVREKAGYWRRESKYDFFGNELRRSFFGPANEPVVITDDDGYIYAAVEKTHDDYGNLVEVATFGPDGKRMIDVDGAAIWRGKYDADGNRIEVSYAGLDGEPVIGSDGYALLRSQYDILGRVKRVEYFDIAGKPTTNSEGVAAWAASYDTRGNIIEERFFDKSGLPASNSTGYAIRRNTRDARGNELEVEYFDKNDRPVLNLWDTLKPGLGGYSRWSRRYDSRNRVVEESFYGARGERALHEDRWWRALYRYERGWSERIETTYFGLDDQPVASLDGYHKVTQKLDDYGRVLEIKFLDARSSAVNSRAGYCRTVMSYDSYGHEVARAYFAADGSPAREGAHHRWDAHYDERGRWTETRWYGVDGQPVPESDGYAQAKMKYDVRGNLIDRAYFNEKGEPRGGTSWKYDPLGNEIEEAHYGSYTAEWGVARILRKFDSYRRIAEERRLDSQGRVVRVTTNRYDSRGKITYIAHKDLFGEPMLGPGPDATGDIQCAIWTAQYNEEGKILKSRCQPLSSIAASD